MFSRLNPTQGIRRSRPIAFAIVAALALGSEAHASCNDRPGTPTDMSAIPLSSSSIRLNWRDTTREGEIPLGPFYDIEVTDKNGAAQPQSVTGQGYLFGGKVFEHLDFNKTYCFRVKARTEQGTQGCVSLRWSGRVCATTFVPPLTPGVRMVNGRGPWVAVAASQNGFWGYQVNAATEDQARKDARSGCGSAASRCNDINAAKAKCIAYVESRQGGYWFGVGIGNRGSDVVDTAMKGCSSGAPAGSCKLIDAVCRRR